MPGFSIQVFLPDGTASGVRIVTKSHWSGVGVMCSRSEYPHASRRDEFRRTGVYVLIGPSEDGTGRSKVYVGEGDVVHTRIKQHDLAKDFWTDVVVFTKTDSSLNKADVRYLEARLVELARSVAIADVENGTVPAPPAPPEALQADLESFLQDMLTILSLLGVGAFEGTRMVDRRRLDVAPGVSDDGDVYTMRVGGAEGAMRVTKEGYLLLAGDGILAEEKPSLGETYRAIRRRLREQGTLVDAADPLRLHLVQDTLLKSPTAAAAVVYGASISGRSSWKDAHGRSLADRERAAVVGAG